MLLCYVEEKKILQKLMFMSGFRIRIDLMRIRIRNLYADPDPAAQINADPDLSRLGSSPLPGSRRWRERDHPFRRPAAFCLQLNI